MQIKEKNWIWYLTPAANAFTTIGDTIYYPKGRLPPPSTIAHEEIHARQQKEVGIVKFILLYLLVLPVLWNPWRRKWETEAYMDGTGLTQEQANKKLRSGLYGWLV